VANSTIGPMSGYLDHVPRRILFAVLAALVLMLIGFQVFSSGKIVPGLVRVRVQAAPNLPLGTVLSERIAVEREVIGSIQSRIPVVAASRVAARVMRVDVRSGDRVKPGQVLVELDESDLRGQLAQAEGEVAASEAELARAAADEKRFSALFSRGSVTAREHESADAAYKAAQAKAGQAKAALAAARSAFEYAIVRSSVRGVVVERMVEAGDMAMPGNPLVRLYDDGALRAELEVPEELRGQIALGTPLDLQVGPDRAIYHARVDEIVPAADPASRSFIVRANLPAGKELTPGTFVRATFASGTAEVLTVAPQAVEEIGQLHMVRVYQNGEIESRMVSVGRKRGDRVEILAGLRPGERVLLKGAAAK
jgi:RND family efflux transporter MFP subunit